MRRWSLAIDGATVLRCPACGQEVTSTAAGIACTKCVLRFPIVDGIPILLNERNSLFAIGDFVHREPTTGPSPEPIGERLRRVLPKLSRNVQTAQNYSTLRSLLETTIQCPRVLVIGGGELGEGIDQLLKLRGGVVVETDVRITDRTVIVCDAHDLCFADETFDAVIIQAVLEHVIDPYRCVDEVHRVLRTSGLVYAETPFMQQVHAGPYDFTRFTPLGHRRLFRRFAELQSGTIAGPGTVMAWSYSHLLQGFATGHRGKLIAVAVARLTGFWLKYFDRLLVGRPGAESGASCVYFLGRRSQETLTDSALLKLYRGIP